MNYVLGVLVILAALCVPPWVLLRLLPSSVESKLALAGCIAISAALGFGEGLLIAYTCMVAVGHGDVVGSLAAVFQATLFGILSLCTIGVVLSASVFLLCTTKFFTARQWPERSVNVLLRRSNDVFSRS